MLQASRFHITEGQAISISGAKAGRNVRCSPQALSTYNELVAMSASNYWAGMIVRGIKGLSCGRLHMDNIYVEQARNISHGNGLFYAILPGVRATFEELNDGSYQLMFLKPDRAYFEKQRQESKPGLWKFDSSLSDQGTFRPEGQIENRPCRPVTITDQIHGSAADAAHSAQEAISQVNSSIRDVSQSSGFDLHFTPGKNHIVGLKNANASLNAESGREIIESATLLANTMYKARNIEGVVWCSDWGGSAVLTRALQILKKQEFKFTKAHSVFLHRPTTPSSKTLELAGELGLKLAGNGGTKQGLRINEIRGNHLDDKVTFASVLAATSFGASAVGAVGTFAALSPLTAITGAGVTALGVAGTVGAMFFVNQTIRTAADKLTPQKYQR